MDEHSLSPDEFDDLAETLASLEERLWMGFCAAIDRMDRECRLVSEDAARDLEPGGPGHPAGHLYDLRSSAVGKRRAEIALARARKEFRRSAGRHIKVDTAEVWFEYGQTLDPYGEHDLPDELRQVGRNFFAMDPVERIPVLFGDLDEELRRALEAKRAEIDREGWTKIVEIGLSRKPGATEWTATGGRTVPS
jgi:hypothetical protein